MRIFTLLVGLIFSTTQTSWGASSLGFQPDEKALRIKILSTGAMSPLGLDGNWFLLQDLVSNLASAPTGQKRIYIESEEIENIQFTPGENISDAKTANFSADLRVLLFQAPLCDEVIIHLRGKIIAPLNQTQIQILNEFTVSPGSWAQCV